MSPFFITCIIIVNLVVVGLIAYQWYLANEAKKNSAHAAKVAHEEYESLLGEMYVNSAMKNIVRDLRQEEEARLAKLTVFEQTIESFDNPDLIRELYVFCECGAEYFKQDRPEHICINCGADFGVAA